MTNSIFVIVIFNSEIGHVKVMRTNLGFYLNQILE